MEDAASDLERRRVAAAEAANIFERGIKEAAKEAEVKSAAAKATAFLLFLVVVLTDRGKMFYYSQ